jgi:hypothetical protein
MATAKKTPKTQAPAEPPAAAAPSAPAAPIPEFVEPAANLAGRPEFADTQTLDDLPPASVRTALELVQAEALPVLPAGMACAEVAADPGSVSLFHAGPEGDRQVWEVVAGADGRLYRAPLDITV